MIRRAILATALALLAGCSRGGTSRHDVAPRSELIVAQQREPQSLNPALENGASSTQWGELLFQYLVKYDAQGRLVGDAASQVPTLANGGISRDGRTIVYHLRPGLRFADGTALTARDCAWSIDAINDPRNNVQTRYGYSTVAKAEARDDRTLVLHLRRPFAPILTLVLAPQGFPILPRHLLASYPDFNQIPFNTQPIGSGPYVVTRWAHGDRVELRANPYYPGGVKIAHLQVSFVPDTSTILNLLRTREVDGMFNDLDAGDLPLLRTIRGQRVTATPVNAVGALIFNTADPVTSDPRVRHALAEAIDIRTLIAKTYRGAVDAHAAGRGLFIWAYDPTAYPDIPYDPVHARTLLDAAGWTSGPDGVRRKNGRRLELLLVIQAATPGDTIIANGIEQYARAVGASIVVKAFNVTQLVAPANAGGPVYGGKFQLALYPFVNGNDPDTTDQFACANVPPHGYNKSRICDPAIDALLNDGKSTYDVARRKAIYAQLEHRLYEELPIVLLYQRREIDSFTRRLRGQTTSVDSAWWNVAAWSLEHR